MFFFYIYIYIYICVCVCVYEVIFMKNNWSLLVDYFVHKCYSS